ncbi:MULTISPECIES: M20 family peptidase [unclassified Variovorax]|uniref:M20 family peptidase n=1 Tax=unclassified Variovorax TaxID=663243 RepID=UPI00076DBE42|nr:MULTISPECIES: M20 family peptidase [unclassified Variovorax]KWT82924.1 macromolecule metabolism [Variovorax sp. WDL1]PNG52472.1 Succinyl-diaminopimelate desuccinylase [Variovorax sp. B4]PNG55012.1 Succinyl-diaminopimelate desuccinylase [Variovorax sp. B2]VTV16036.1 Succinyl-diaminopimelate desuccinylase [Variovorax sp. WDL1]
MVKRVLVVLLLAVLVLVAVTAGNTWRRPSLQLQVPPAPRVEIDEKAAAQRLAGAIPIRTVSGMEGLQANGSAFKELHAYLAQQFPKLHATLKKEVVGDNALLYTWTGSDPAARPIALMAHQDVVPIAPGTEKAWQTDPFSGQIKDGFVWGRGTWDNKGNLLAQMEAIEMLLAGGFQPRQTVYLVAGDDEEVSGLRGAKPIAELLKSRGVRLEWVLDEGLLVTEGVLAGLDRPAALIGLAEKGYGTFFLSVDQPPGHSSMPPARSAIGSMSTALAKLEANPMPAAIGGVAGEMFATLAPEMNGFNRVALSNLWLFGPLVRGQLEKGTSSNAMLRTTTALTVVRAGNKDNVLPGRAEAAVNFRVLPGDSLASVEAHIRKTIDNDTIAIKPYPGNSEPSPVSPTDSLGYRTIAQSVRQVFPDAIVAPGLMIAATDSRHFSILSDAVYRFSPVRARPEDLSRFHGTNERILIANYVEMIRFYHQLLRNTAQPQ